MCWKATDGIKHAATYCLTTDATFKGKFNPSTFRIIPSLQENLYLGIDFVRICGLAKGRTGIRQRHLGVSPAVEKCLFAEIDKILVLEVIEQRQTP